MAEPNSHRVRSFRGTLGNLESFGLPEIIQSLALARKTARITLTSEGRFGHIWLEDGTAKHSRTGRFSGELAFYEMVAWKTGEFLIEPDVCTESRSLDHDPMYLVMEGSRRMDESAGAASTDKPPPGFEILQTIPLSAPEPGPALPTPAPRTRGRDRPVTQARPEPIGRLLSLPRGPRERRRLWILAATIVPLFAIGLWLPTRGRVSAPPDRSLGAPFERIASPVIEPSPDAPDPEENAAADATRVVAASKPVARSAPRPPVRAADAVSSDGEFKGRVQLLDLSPGALAPALFFSDPAATPGSGTENPAFLRILGKSNVKAGTLTVQVDGAEVYARDLVAQPGKAKRFFKRLVGRGGESFEATIEIEPGHHEIVASVVLEDDGTGFDSSAVVEIDAGATREVRLVAGRLVGRPVTLKVD